MPKAPARYIEVRDISWTDRALKWSIFATPFLLSLILVVMKSLFVTNEDFKTYDKARVEEGKVVITRVEAIEKAIILLIEQKDKFLDFEIRLRALERSRVLSGGNPIDGRYDGK